MKLILCSFLFFLSVIKSTFACGKIEYSNQIKNSNFDLNILSLQGNLKKIDKVINGLPDGFYKEYILGVSFLDGKGFVAQRFHNYMILKVLIIF
ncbi:MULTISPECIES: hypothetical protein [Acinetobacter]|uniref:hypothetical protein n=1 Tax=Acinetobacter TaxID=469 RepID=UPI001D0F0078|nr:MULTISPECIES: hypothetical protein [Acinetobacter]